MGCTENDELSSLLCFNIRCRRNVYTKWMPSNNWGIHRHIHRLSFVMTWATQKTMHPTSLLRFMYSLPWEPAYQPTALQWQEGDIYRHTDWQEGFMKYVSNTINDAYVLRIHHHKKFLNTTLTSYWYCFDLRFIQNQAILLNYEDKTKWSGPQRQAAHIKFHKNWSVTCTCSEIHTVGTNQVPSFLILVSKK